MVGHNPKLLLMFCEKGFSFETNIVFLKKRDQNVQDPSPRWSEWMGKLNHYGDQQHIFQSAVNTRCCSHPINIFVMSFQIASGNRKLSD